MTDLPDPVAFETAAPAAGDVVVIGGGIIGLACAFALQDAGRRVVVIERKGIAQETSYGNAGAFAFSDVLPLASAGKLAKVPQWLLDPLGPLTIPPRYLPTILPWLMRFWRAGWRDRIAASIAAQAALMRLSRQEMEAMTQAAGLSQTIRTTGSLELYESEAEFAAAQPGWAARAAEGITFEHLRGDALAQRQPGLAKRFAVGTFVPQWQLVSDPYAFACGLARAAHARGVQFVRAEVAELAPSATGATLTLADGTRIAAAKAVVAGGAWSRALTAPLGDRIPLETERGYNTTLPRSAFALETQLIFGGHGFVISPLECGIRVGGAVELGGLKTPPNFARADAMLKKAKTFLPTLETEGGRQWMGFRPSLPDSLPAIGRSRASEAIVYAFGHGHLGLTQAAGTARLVEQTVNAERPGVDLAAFSPQRFRLSAGRETGTGRGENG